MIFWLPKRYSLALPSTRPVPEMSTWAVEPSAATDSTCTSVMVGTICSGKVPSVKSVRTAPTSE